MAGRGTDIVLGPGVADGGGLHIVGTERHESRRIDNQLRGRAGRQGDPGSSRFFLALDDDLMRIFGGERIKGMMNMLRVADDEPIESRLVSRQIEGAQTKVEGHNFDARRYLVEYDDVMNKQREIIYGERRKVLEGADLREHVQGWIRKTVEDAVNQHCESRHPDNWDLEGLHGQLGAVVPLPPIAEIAPDEVGATKEAPVDRRRQEADAAAGEPQRWACDGAGARRNRAGAQRSLLVRQRQEIQEVPRAVRWTAEMSKKKSTTTPAGKADPAKAAAAANPVRPEDVAQPPTAPKAAAAAPAARPAFRRPQSLNFAGV